MNKIKVYIAGPYTNGDVAKNVKKAIVAANNLVVMGFAPYIPHLTHFWHLVSPKPYHFWLEYDLEFLDVCDCVLRLKGESSGADGEVQFAIKKGLPVFHSFVELEKHYGSKKNEL